MDSTTKEENKENLDLMYDTDAISMDDLQQSSKEHSLKLTQEESRAAKRGSKREGD